jgi:cytochrome P450
MWTVTVGGLNTTAALTSLSLHHLATHPEDRQLLIDHPELHGSATEEFLRYFSIQRSNTRTVTQDIELAGQRLCRGDRLLINRLSANRDEKVFDRPDEVVLDRDENPHLAFGLGPHRCIGSNVARLMFRVMLSEVLTRIPDFEIDEKRVVPYDGSPSIAGILELPATFTPGAVIGVNKPY